MKRLFPMLLVIIALAGGAGAGLYLGGGKACAAGGGAAKPAAAPSDDCAEEGVDHATLPTEYAALKRQFVIPVMHGGKVEAMVVASLAVEMIEGTTEIAFSSEPKLRDAFLQVFFVHAHSGGFDGAFTQHDAMTDLRARLQEVAEPILGDSLRAVLITDIVRQDL